MSQERIEQLMQELRQLIAHPALLPKTLAQQAADEELERELETLALEATLNPAATEAVVRFIEVLERGNNAISAMIAWREGRGF